MNYKSFRALIANSVPNDWLTDDEHGVWVLKNDLLITIQREVVDSPEVFTEEWATKCPDPHAYVQRYFLKYGENIIETIYTASIDGRRVDIPYPRLPDMTIATFEYTIGKIINDERCWNEYTRMKNITVRQ